MLRDEMVAEISMRLDIPMEDVEEVLEEQDAILAEECKCKKRRKCICIFGTMAIFLMGAATAIYILEKKEKIDLEETMKKYMEKFSRN